LEPITHFLTGACLGRAGLNRKTALATLTLTLAAEAPDIDVFAGFGGRVFSFAHHRGFTHSFLGLPLVAAAVVGLVWLIWRLRGRKTHNNLAPRWGLLFLYAYLAGLSHILLDFTNNYGVRPFWPSGVTITPLLTAFSSASLRSRLAPASAEFLPTDRRMRFAPSRHSR